MSREEAINIIKSECYIFNPLDFDRSTMVNTALDMAIKALEEEPTTKNDLAVDNQNIRLIDANALIKRLRPKHFDWWGEGEQDDFSKGNNSMLEEVIEAIEEFPSVVCTIDGENMD